MAERSPLLRPSRGGSVNQAYRTSRDGGELALNGELSEDGKLSRIPVGQASWVQVCFTIINGFVGGGLLGLPYGFMQGGLIAGIIGLLVLAAFAYYTLNLLAFIKMEYSGKLLLTYPDMGEAAYGRPGRIAVQVFVCASQIGYASAYLVFIITNISTLHILPLNKWVAIAIVLPVMILLSWVREIKRLSFTSIVAFVAIVASVAIVVQYGVTNQNTEGPTSTKIEPLKEYTMFDGLGLAVFFGITDFAYVQHGLILNQHASLKNPFEFRKTINTSMIFTTVIYLVFGILAYLFFKDDTKAVITENLGTSIEADLVKIALSLVLIFAFPLQLFPVSDMVEMALFGPRLDADGSKTTGTLARDTFARNALRTFIVAASLGAAIAVPLFGLFSSLVGCLSNSVIAFVFPPLFYVKLFFWNHAGPRWTRLAVWKVVINLILCVLGVVGVFVSSTIVIGDIARCLQHPDKHGC